MILVLKEREREREREWFRLDTLIQKVGIHEKL